MLVCTCGRQAVIFTPPPRRPFYPTSKSMPTLRPSPRRPESLLVSVAAAATTVNDCSWKTCLLSPQAPADRDIVDAARFSEIRYQKAFRTTHQNNSKHDSFILFGRSRSDHRRRWGLQDAFYYVSRVEMTDILIYSFDRFAANTFGNRK